MKFHEIATFLNIPEAVVRSLSKRKIIPGRPCSDGWQTTLDEIERWYVKLSGKEWAALVANGQVDPLMAEVDLECEVTTGLLLAVLRSWERKEIVKIISHNLEADAIPEVAVTLCEVAEEGRKGIQSLEQTGLKKWSRSQLQLVYRCQKIIGKNPVLVSLPKKRVLRFSIEDAMAEMPQREREIIRFHLSSYALRLSTELRGKYEHKNSE